MMISDKQSIIGMNLIGPPPSACSVTRLGDGREKWNLNSLCTLRLPMLSNAKAGANFLS